ncbi:metallothionein-like protein type 2 [Ananas comosus]|uniref:Metallothionein-like protein n=1 Tax=Ananas comosus TaxID=4615 RepID=A0A6P5ETW6_ANACO|nr:metallothionein-like protein type 2 [Ananas comosus]
MSCCGGNCGCGSGCNCGSGCGGCKMYPHLSGEGMVTTQTMIFVAAPQKGKFESFEVASGECDKGGCSSTCGPNCNCSCCGCK